MNIDYDGIVSICDAHGICLPVDCVEMVVEIVKHATAQPDHSGDEGEKTARSGLLALMLDAEEGRVSDAHLGAMFRVLVNDDGAALKRLERAVAERNASFDARPARTECALTDEHIHEIAASYMEADSGVYVSFLPSNLDKFSRALLTAHPEAAQPSRAEVLEEEARFDATELILRDVCETAPADPDLNDTVCIDISVLKAIIDRYLPGKP